MMVASPAAGTLSVAGGLAMTPTNSSFPLTYQGRSR